MDNTIEEIFLKAVKNILVMQPNTPSMKDYLNAFGTKKNITFTSPTQKINLGILISILCDECKILSAPECKKIFQYI
jgi:hypothetical protein